LYDVCICDLDFRAGGPLWGTIAPARKSDASHLLPKFSGEAQINKALNPSSQVGIV
jgi:hypothetical protein